MGVSRINHIPIESMGLSVRAYNILTNAGFEFIGEVLKQSDKQLLSIRNLGKQTLKEIKEVLFDEERVLEIVNREALPHDADCIASSNLFTVRTYNLLMRRGIKTFSELRQTTDKKLKSIRGLGAGILAEIDIVVPDRVRGCSKRGKS